MQAAVVTSFDRPPQYAPFPDPIADGEHEIVVDVLASAVHPRVRSQANGSHYTSTGELPLVPGVDGVGRDGDGRLRYFALSGTTLGAMAERTVVDTRASVLLPDDSDVVGVAAAMNPAMSSWVALRRRISFHSGQNVLVLGATGNAGRLAVQVASRFGAGQVLAAARNPELLAALPALGATGTVALDDPVALGRAACEVDVVIDYVWGAPTAAAMVPIVTERVDRGRPLTWIAIGSVAGQTAQIPAAALRAAKLQIVGSGQGSVTGSEFVAELPELAEAITDGTLAVTARARPLRDVERAWADAPTSRERIVLTP